MAALRTTTRGQLFKYVEPLIEILKDNMISGAAFPVDLKRGTVSLKNTQTNFDILDQFVELAKIDERAALSLKLETMTNDFISFYNFEKPKSVGNFGDIAEGVMAVGLFLRLLNKTIVSVDEILNFISRLKPEIYDYSSIYYDSYSEEKLLEIVFEINLAPSNMRFFLSQDNKNIRPIAEKVINFCNSDYINQKFSENFNYLMVRGSGYIDQNKNKSDVLVSTRGNSNILNILEISLKYGETSQLGQVGATYFDGVKEFWSKSIGIDIEYFRNSFNELVAIEKIEIAQRLIFDNCFKKLKEMKDLPDRLVDGIEYFATGKNDEIILVQLNGDTKVLGFKDVKKQLTGKEFSVTLHNDHEKRPKIVFSLGDEKFITLRLKVENQSYCRLYFEKGPGMDKLLRIN